MTFSSIVFVFAFLPIALAGYYLLRSNLKNAFLVLISLLFYACGEPKFVLVLMADILLNYGFGLAIEEFRTKPIVTRSLMIIILSGNIGMLLSYKYLYSAVSSFNQIANTSFSVPNLALPLGISFFTFRTISYILDVYWGTSKAQENILSLALYISFFPQITSGPIVKYNNFENQIAVRTWNLELFVTGIKRLIIGLSKKVLIADMIAVCADRAFGLANGELSFSFAWLGAITFLLQLYYDFSGYSDMAIGLGNMFGFNCPENFDYPFISKSVGEYWRRWHITLGAWLKDYIYTPVFRSMMKKKNIFTKQTMKINECDLFALFITWLICGPWHGSGWTYLAYGMWYFVFIALERLLQAREKKRLKLKKLPKPKEKKWVNFCSHIFTMLIVIFGTVIFRSNSIHSAITYMQAMLGLSAGSFVDSVFTFFLNENKILYFVGIIFCIPTARKVKEICNKYMILSRISYILSPIIYMGLFFVAISFTVTSSYSPFIYFKF
ncbi:MAG: MBOAT family O-acyltransferase [Hydrogenoanaerobacterium sp.]